MVGREKEIGDLINLLKNPEVGLITLHGLGGTGKTRLAVETGQAALEFFPDGVWFVALAPLSSSEYIISATAAALGYSFQSHEDQQSQLIRFLHDKKLLLIFDNMEHLLPEGATYLEEFFQNTTEAKFLVTSRQPINTVWEWVYPLHGLEYEGSIGTSNGELPAAVQLFLQHLSRVAGPEAGNDESCATQICQLVRGLPLALLLAASWGRALECNEIVQEIQRSIGFLQTQQKTFPERHSSMQVVFDYSWRLLSDQEQSALRKLSVFRGGFERHAAAQVAGADLIILSTLIDQAFVERVGNDRYQIHELLRQYLRKHLQEAGEEQITCNQHLQYYLHLVKQAEPELFGKNQRAWLEKLQSEIGNLRTALDWSLASQDHANLESALRMMTYAERFWLLHTNTKEGHSYIVQMLAYQPDLQSLTSHVYAYAQGLNLAARISFFLEDLHATRQFAEKALQIGLELNDARIIADSYYFQGVEANHRGESITARPLLERSIEYFRQCDYLPGLTQAINVLGRADLFNRDFSASFSNLSTALELARKLEDMPTIYRVLRSLGQLGIAYPQIGPSRARHYFEESLQYAREQEDKLYIGLILHEMGELARLEGEHEKAAILFEEADTIANELGQKEGRIMPQLCLGFVYTHLGQYDRSKRIFINNMAATQVDEHLKLELSLCLLGLAGLEVAEGQAKFAAKILGAIDKHKSVFMFWPPDKNEYERILSLIKTQISEQQFNQLMKEGQTLSLGDVAQLIQNQIVMEKLPNDERLNQLTKREIEFLRLVAQGLSDAQVAERLVLSNRTVNAHLTSIYRKLDVKSRAAATRFAIGHGLA